MVDGTQDLTKTDGDTDKGGCELNDQGLELKHGVCFNSDDG